MILLYKNYLLTLFCLSDIIKVLYCESFTESVKNERSKRFLLVPETGPTRHQLIVGVGIPVDLEKESCTYGLVIKAQYYMPVRIEDLKPDYFWPDRTEPVVTQFKKRSLNDENGRTIMVANDTDALINQVSGNKVEVYQVEAVQIDQKSLNENKENRSSVEMIDDQNIDFDKSTSAQDIQNSRWVVYKGIEGILKYNGMEGRPCLLRCICEAAQSRFNHANGILGELVNTILSPSTTNEMLSTHKDNEYYRAEAIGKSGEPCDQIFYECDNSILDMFSGVIDPIKVFETFLS